MLVIQRHIQLLVFSTGI